MLKESMTFDVKKGYYMGVIKTITFDTFPKQSKYVGRRVRVCFHYNTDQWLEGTIIRDDTEEPNITIFELDNGNCILSTECQYQIK